MKMSEEERKRQLNICFWVVMIVAALAFLAMGYFMHKAVKSDTAVKTVQETEAEVEEEEELVFADNPYDGVIPSVRFDHGEEPTPLGVELPPAEIWEESTPLFLYTNPENWDVVYKEKEGDRYVAHVGNYYLEVSFWGPVGPVWKYTSYNGKLCGVTDHTFLFEQNGKTYAVEQGSVSMGVTHLFEELPLTEQNTKEEAAEVPFIPAENVQINSFYDVEYTIVEGTGVWVEMPDAWAFKPEMVRIYDEESVRWFQFRPDRMFFTHKTLDGKNEAVFIGGKNGYMEVLHIPYDGEFLGADARGIYYAREGEHFFKSFYGAEISGKMVYPEVPECLISWGIEFPREIWGDPKADSTHPDMTPPFLENMENDDN